MQLSHFLITAIIVTVLGPSKNIDLKCDKKISTDFLKGI